MLHSLMPHLRCFLFINDLFSVDRSGCDGHVLRSLVRSTCTSLYRARLWVTCPSVTYRKATQSMHGHGAIAKRAYDLTIINVFDGALIKRLVAFIGVLVETPDELHATS